MRFLLATCVALSCWSFTVLGETEDSVKPPAPPELLGELIFLRDFGTDEVGYLVIPQKPPKAGLVIAHGKFGLNREFRQMCDRLSEDGYIVLAVDLFNGNIPSNKEDVAKNQKNYSSQSSVAAIETAVNFFRLSPRFKMDKVIALGIKESSKDVLAVARKNRALTGITLLDPPVLPNAELMNEMGIPVLAFISTERTLSVDTSEINRESEFELTIQRMAEVVFDDNAAFKRHINERAWEEASVRWMQWNVPERSIADRLIDSVF